MFQNTASFPGIARGTPSIAKRLMVSDVIQKSGIEVDEEGSIIFSATGKLCTNFVSVAKTRLLRYSAYK